MLHLEDDWDCATQCNKGSIYPWECYNPSNDVCYPFAQGTECWTGTTRCPKPVEFDCSTMCADGSTGHDCFNGTTRSCSAFLKDGTCTEGTRKCAAEIDEYEVANWDTKFFHVVALIKQVMIVLFSMIPEHDIELINYFQDAFLHSFLTALPHMGYVEGVINDSLRNIGETSF